MSQNTATVDPRGLRFGAAITSVILATVILVPTPYREILLLAQAVTFALGALLGPSATPQGRLFATVVRPRIGAAGELEDARPPQFAQAVGLGFAAPALVLLFLGFNTAGLILVGFALAAALLNAVTGFCLGCEMYLATRRLAKQLV